MKLITEIISSKSRQVKRGYAYWSAPRGLACCVIATLSIVRDRLMRDLGSVYNRSGLVAEAAAGINGHCLDRADVPAASVATDSLRRSVVASSAVSALHRELVLEMEQP